MAQSAKLIETLKTGGWMREQNAIGGAWRDADSGETHRVINPSTGQVIGKIPWSGKAETKAAIDAAHAAFKTWSLTLATERAEGLLRMAAIMRENVELLASMLTLEQGKPLPEARAEVLLSANYIQWFAEEARRSNGLVIPSPWRNNQILVTKEPVGVVAAISPWNFPMSMLSRKIAPALAAGCTIVVKPAELTPYCGLAYAAIAEKAGLPPGVVNVVIGKSSEIGAEMISNPLVRKLTFTGSTRVGKLLYQQSAETMKKLSMELGGNAPLIVFDDADLELAVDKAIAGKFRNSGQTCVCANRFYVQDGIYDAFATRLTEKVKALKVGDGFDAGVQQGPLINQAAVDKGASTAIHSGPRSRARAWARQLYEAYPEVQGFQYGSSRNGHAPPQSFSTSARREPCRRNHNFTVPSTTTCWSMYSNESPCASRTGCGSCRLQPSDRAKGRLP